jgi:hypothetical protein
MYAQDHAALQGFFLHRPHRDSLCLRLLPQGPSRRIGAALVAFCLASCLGATATATQLVFDFTTSSHGFQPGFTDYPIGEEEFYELQSNYGQLPLELGGAPAWFISGNNHSDDLFMYFRHQISGLLPSTSYDLEFHLTLASQAPDGSVGIGGSPANSVYVKAGASASEPIAVPGQDALYRLSVDKGEQSNGGSHAHVLGDIAKPDDGTELFALIERRSSLPLSVTSSPEGTLWLFFGTDSGFEGTTNLYYTRLEVRLVPEPSGLSLAALALLCGHRLRRRSFLQHCRARGRSGA